jgi:acetyl esterase/lipase
MADMTTSDAARRPTAGARRRVVVAAAVGLLALVGAGCSLAPIPGAAPLRYRDEIFPTVVKTSDVTFGQALDQQGVDVTLKMDIYRPVGDTNTARPVVVYAHGGSFSSGNKTEGDIVDEAQFMAKKGYVAASIDYRLAQPGCAPPSSKCGQAIVDATHDAMAGTSAGAITALLVGYQSNDPGTSGNPGFSSAVSAAVSLSGAALFNGSIDASDPPALDFHGTADSLVPYAWTQATADAAKAAGVEYDLVTWQGDGHVPYLEHRNQILDLSANFLYRKLDLAHAATS